MQQTLHGEAAFETGGRLPNLDDDLSAVGEHDADHDRRPTAPEALGRNPRPEVVRTPLVEPVGIDAREVHGPNLMGQRRTAPLA
ncbi:hypothetical protein ACH4M4_34805 [Streptomyces sp. NPDC017254]|uniref:hypothetical protein n=1 Tax=unclassified Streptomyces TaxID=2593676 RepID=UPI00378A04DE